MRLLAGLVAAGLALAPLGTSGEAAPDFRMEDVVFVGSRGSANEIVLHAEGARFDPETRVALLETVEASVTGAAGGPRFDIRCQRGEYHVDTGDFIAEGRVRGRTHEGRNFATTRLRYDHDAELVTTDEPVVIDDETGRFHGGGFRYHVREGRFRLIGGARVETQ